jgi:uncharacterized membrane protein YsdA (DUF1294 family)
MVMLMMWVMVLMVLVVMRWWLYRFDGSEASAGVGWRYS